MALITDEEWLVRRLRIEFLRSEDATAERIITFPRWDHIRRVGQATSAPRGSAVAITEAASVVDPVEGQVQARSSGGQPEYGYFCPYVDDQFAERGLCYSPKVHAPELPQHTQLTNPPRNSPANPRKQQLPNASSSREQLAQKQQQQQQQQQPPRVNQPAQNATTTSSSKVISDQSLAPGQSPPRQTLVFKKQPLGPKTPKRFGIALRQVSPPADNRPQTPTYNSSAVSVSSISLGSPEKSPSKLAQMIARQRNQATTNPFARDYSHVCGRGERQPITLRIYLPASAEPLRPLALLVKRESTVEEVIGYALFAFIEEKRKPEYKVWSPTHRGASSWNLRIVEEDGIIDEDFPALERSRKISKFAFDQFALCTATNTPLQQTSTSVTSSPGKMNSSDVILIKVHTYATMEVKQTTTVALRRDALMSDAFTICCKKVKVDPERFVMKMVDTITEVPMDKTLETLGIVEVCLISKKASRGDAVIHPLSMDQIVFLKVHMYSTLHVKQTTTVALHKDTLMSKVFEECCKKGKVERPEEFVLRMVDTITDVPMNRTLAETGLTEVCLLKKSSGDNRGDIFLQPSTENSPVENENYGDLGTAAARSTSFLTEELASTYRKYNVTRKTALFSSKQDRHLVIDGSDVYIMPADQEHIHDKTVGFHVSALVSCQVAKKGATTFRLSFQKFKEIKALEFDAANPQEAAEICAKLTFLSQVNKDRG